ncbi:MAG: hypothetical protein LC122_13810 [Chitinophagales bacterium]|nr:hypothetical protein [Chitinophagales bacterium]
MKALSEAERQHIYREIKLGQYFYEIVEKQGKKVAKFNIIDNGAAISFVIFIALSWNMKLILDKSGLEDISPEKITHE